MIDMFKVIKELMEFMENETDKYPNLIEFLKKKFGDVNKIRELWKWKLKIFFIGEQNILGLD